MPAGILGLIVRLQQFESTVVQPLTVHFVKKSRKLPPFRRNDGLTFTPKQRGGRRRHRCSRHRASSTRNRSGWRICERKRHRDSPRDSAGQLVRRRHNLQAASPRRADAHSYALFRILRGDGSPRWWREAARLRPFAWLHPERSHGTRAAQRALAPAATQLVGCQVRGRRGHTWRHAAQGNGGAGRGGYGSAHAVSCACRPMGPHYLTAMLGPEVGAASCKSMRGDGPPP